MRIIKAHNSSSAWISASKTILEEGTKRSGLIEILNLVIEIEPKKRSVSQKDFDQKFRMVFGDERIDFAQSVTFVRPKYKGWHSTEMIWRTNDDTASWNKTMWGRLIKWNGHFNQIEHAIKRLKKGNDSKTICAIVFDPLTDGKRNMGTPCLLSLDFKPRDGKLFMNAFFRSQAISKAGYADFTALVEMQKFLCKESGLEKGTITNIATSAHIRSMNNEKKNTLKLLELLKGKSK
jgi:thymidylate synthase